MTPVCKWKQDRVDRLRLAELERLAKQAGYESTEKMLRELYVEKRVSIDKLVARLFTTHRALYKVLRMYKIPIRKRGGPNNVKVVLTDALFAEICRDGAAAVAERLGVDVTTLRERLKRRKA